MSQAQSALHLRRAGRARPALSLVQTFAARPTGLSLRASAAEDFILGDILGQGSYSLVQHARRRSTGEEVAMKILVPNDADLASCVKAEFELLRNIDHPHIIHALEEVCYDAGNVLVWSFRGRQTLDTFVRQSGPLLESQAKHIFTALLQAVRHLHDAGISHRDITPRNVLVSHDLQDLRLIDFNAACWTREGSLTPAGARQHAPPEVLLGDSPSEGADVWGAGICLHLALSGCLPQGRDACGLSEALLCKAARRAVDLSGPQWEGVSQRCRELLRRCLALELDGRPSAQELLELVRLWWPGADGISPPKAALGDDEPGSSNSSATFAAKDEDAGYMVHVDSECSTSWTSEGIFESATPSMEELVLCASCED